MWHHLEGIAAASVFALTRNNVMIIVFMLLSAGLLVSIAWNVTKPRTWVFGHGVKLPVEAFVSEGHLSLFSTTFG